MMYVQVWYFKWSKESICNKLLVLKFYLFIYTYNTMLHLFFFENQPVNTHTIEVIQELKILGLLNIVISTYFQEHLLKYFI